MSQSGSGGPLLFDLRSRLASRRARGLGLLLLALLLPGCAVDTQILTEVSEDGSVKRSITFQLNDLDRDKEAQTYPAKVFRLPAAPGWKVTEDVGRKLAVERAFKPGEAVAGGYERHLTALDRTSRNTVRVERRDHFICTSYQYEETFSDTVTEEEFRKILQTEYEEESKRILAEAAKVFGETHDLSLAERYITQDLQKLVQDTADKIARSGVITGLGTMVFRLAFGGFPIKNIDQLLDSDPRDVIRALYRHCLDRARLKPERLVKIDEEAFLKGCEQLKKGSIDEQAAARKALCALGPALLRRMEGIIREERQADPKSGYAERMTQVVGEIRAGMSQKMDELVRRLAAETEKKWLKPEKEKGRGTEERLAKLLGAHIEANFAPCEYFFLLRLKLPGELAWLDRGGSRLDDGAIRWNFNALSFFIRDKVCAARSRIWNEQALKDLGGALQGNEAPLTLKAREALDDLLASLSREQAARVAAVLEKCAKEKGRQPLQALADDPQAGKPLNQAAARILELVPAASREGAP